MGLTEMASNIHKFHFASQGPAVYSQELQFSLCPSTVGQSVQSLSRVQLFATPWTAACQASLSIVNSRSLLKLISIKSVVPSNHLILCPSTSGCFSSCHWGGPTAALCSMLRVETGYHGNKPHTRLQQQPHPPHHCSGSTALTHQGVIAVYKLDCVN